MKNMKTSITINHVLLVELRKVKGKLQQYSNDKITYEDAVGFLLKQYKKGGKK